MPDHIKKQLQEEISILEHELTYDLPAEIKKAVAMGDLSENAEYHICLLYTSAPATLQACASECARAAWDSPSPGLPCS